jgi:hypothetical protein
MNNMRHIIFFFIIRSGSCYVSGFNGLTVPVGLSCTHSKWHHSPVFQCRWPIPSTSRLFAENIHDGESDEGKVTMPGLPLIPLAVVYGILPLLSITLLDPALSAIADSANALIVLFIGKRLYLYAMAIIALDLASRQSSGTDYKPDFGDRFFQVNEELLGISLASEARDAAETVGVTTALNSTSQVAQGLAVPVVVATGLLVSYFAVTASSSVYVDDGSTGTTSVLALLQPLLPYVPMLPILAVCLLFVKMAAQRLLPNNNETVILYCSHYLPISCGCIHK